VEIGVTVLVVYMFEADPIPFGSAWECAVATPA